MTGSPHPDNPVALTTRTLALAALAVGITIGVLGSGPGSTAEATVESQPCDATTEAAFETMRFARYSHTYWIEEIAAGRATVGTDGFGADWHSWWDEAYVGVLAALIADCSPAADYPPLADLPGEWDLYGYPARPRAEPVK